MKKFLCLIVVVEILFSCSTKKGQSDFSAHDSAKISQEPRDAISLEEKYGTLKADTLISNHGFALIVYERKTPIEPNEILGNWQELKMDSLKGNHVLFKPCEAGIQSFTFKYIDDTLHLQWFRGQAADDFVVTEINYDRQVRLKASNENILINLDYALKPVVGASWRYDNTAVFRWTDNWGKTRTEIFVEDAGSNAIENVNEAPCDN
jgi:hypothetical protein